MARINLLPWRAERRKVRQKEFLMMLVMSALVGFALWFFVNGHYNRQIEGQQARNAFLDKEIAELEKNIEAIKELKDKKEKLLARKQVIEQLQSNRSQMVHLFDSLVRTIPDGVVLTSIKQEGTKLTLEGRSQSNARVSAYMRNFEKSSWMTKPELSIIEAKGEDKGLPYAFSLTVTLSDPSEPGADGAASGVDADVAVANATKLPTLTPTQPATAPAVAPATTSPATAPASASPSAPQQPAKPEKQSGEKTGEPQV